MDSFTSKLSFGNVTLGLIISKIDSDMKCIPLSVLIGAHSKLPSAGLNAAAHHQPISRFKDVQRTRHSGVGHRANKYGYVLG